jgi:hypothetical protein
VVRRLVSALALLAFASTPVVARTQLLCRYTGNEIVDCAEQDVPSSATIRAEGCCERRVTRPVGTLLGAQQREISPPDSLALPIAATAEPSGQPVPARRRGVAPIPTGPPVFLITRALLI